MANVITIKNLLGEPEVSQYSIQSLPDYEDISTTSEDDSVPEVHEEPKTPAKKRNLTSDAAPKVPKEKVKRNVRQLFANMDRLREAADKL